MTQNEPPEKPRSGAPLLGRRIAIGIYWAGILYLLFIGFYSVIPQTFWPTSSLPDATECAPMLTQQLADLRAFSEETVNGSLTREERRNRLASWDDRHRSLLHACEDDERFYDLERLRYRVATTAHRVEDDQGPMFQDLQRRLSP